MIYISLATRCATQSFHPSSQMPAQMQIPRQDGVRLNDDEFGLPFWLRPESDAHAMPQWHSAMANAWDALADESFRFSLRVEC